MQLDPILEPHQAWAAPVCPILPKFPGRLECSEGVAWLLRTEYPDCQRLEGDGYCEACMSDVVAVRIGGPAPPRPVPAAVQLWNPTRSDTAQPERTTWRPT